MYEYITRNCLDCPGTGNYIIVMRTPASLVIKCPRCGRTEEVDPHFHYCIPNSHWMKPGKEQHHVESTRSR